MNPETNNIHALTYMYMCKTTSSTHIWMIITKGIWTDNKSNKIQMVMINSFVLDWLLHFDFSCLMHDVILNAEQVTIINTTSSSVWRYSAWLVGIEQGLFLKKLDTKDTEGAVNKITFTHFLKWSCYKSGLCWFCSFCIFDHWDCKLAIGIHIQHKCSAREHTKHIFCKCISFRYSKAHIRSFVFVCVSNKWPWITKLGNGFTVFWISSVSILRAKGKLLLHDSAFPIKPNFVCKKAALSSSAKAF